MPTSGHDILKDIIKNGSNLVLYKNISYDVLRELVNTAKTSGSKISIRTNIDYKLVRELSLLGGSSITFLDGLD